MAKPPRFRAVLFDLLTALLDSWTLWNAVAGGEEAGRRWRAEYLRRTYGAGDYVPYETLVADAAEATGLLRAHAEALADRWGELKPWPEARRVLAVLAERVPLGVVTNCSEVLGRAAAQRAFPGFQVVVTAERAGAYKPRPEPYALALEELGLPAAQVLFVAGSAFDLPGAGGVGMPVFWHNRVGLAAPPGAPKPLAEAPSLEPLLERVR